MAIPALWTFDLCDGAGVKLTTLSRAAGLSLTFTRNGVPECSFSLAHEDDDCATLLAADKNGTGGGRPTLKGYRNGTLRFNGYLAVTSEESGIDASTATFTFQGPFGRLLGNGSGDGIVITNSISFTATDAGSIAATLISNSTLGPTGTAEYAVVDFSPGGVGSDPQKARDRTYPAFTNIGQAITDLSSVLDGFDFEVVPQVGTEGQLSGTAPSGVAITRMGLIHFYAKQGQDRPGSKFEYGPGTLANSSAMHRQTLPPINEVIVVGSGGLLGVAANATSQAKYGSYWLVMQQPDVSEQATLNDKAYVLLRPNPVKTLDFTPEPRLAPSPWDDYWIGDTVYFYANRGALVEGPIGVRVNQITVAIDPDTGYETSEIPNPETADEAATIRASLQTEVVS